LGWDQSEVEKLPKFYESDWISSHDDVTNEGGTHTSRWTPHNLPVGGESVYYPSSNAVDMTENDNDDMLRRGNHDDTTPDGGDDNDMIGEALEVPLDEESTLNNTNLEIYPDINVI
jgi:hypothetical protein